MLQDIVQRVVDHILVVAEVLGSILLLIIAALVFGVLIGIDLMFGYDGNQTYYG